MSTGDGATLAVTGRLSTMETVTAWMLAALHFGDLETLVAMMEWS